MQTTAVRAVGVRKVLAVAIAVVVAVSWSMAMAEVPVSLTHQGRLTDTDGEPETGEVDLTFTIYDAASGGDILWQDELTAIDLGDSGFYSVELGDQSNPIDAAVLQGGEAYVGVAVDGGDDLQPRIPMNSVPYAQVAAHAETAEAVEGQQFLDGISMFDAVDSGGGVLGEADDDSTAYREQIVFVTASDPDANGQTPAWAIDAQTAGDALANSYAVVSARMKVANNSLDSPLLNYGCIAERDGQHEVLASVEIAPDDFAQEDEWQDFLITCPFGPADTDQEIALMDFEPNVTALSVDFVRVQPFPETPFLSDWMFFDESVTRDAIEEGAVGPGELADERAIRVEPEVCGRSLTLADTCTTQQCGTWGMNQDPIYYECDGSCPGGVNATPNTCSTEHFGYVVGEE